MKHILMLGVFLLFQAMSAAALAAADPTHILIVVGPTNHPPGTHEVAASGRLMADCLQRASNLSGVVKAEVVTALPQDQATLDRYASVVFIGDNFPLTQMPDAPASMSRFAAMMARGCGIVCVHFAVGLQAKDLPDDGAHQLLYWLGGYFAVRAKHHQSVAKIFPSATIEPATVTHPICNGWTTFTLHDEPYINLWWGGEHYRPSTRVTPIASSLLPPEKPQRETVAWATERSNDGRGFGIVMPHFYRNWANADLRRCIMNGIIWSAQLEVPAGGVVTADPDLQRYEPSALEPKATK